MKYWITLILTFMAVAMQAQDCNYKFSGRILDFHTKESLAGAAIEIFSKENKVLSTDLDGYFTIEGLCSPVFEIQVSHPLCSTQTLLIDLNKRTWHEIYLEHHMEELSEVVISDSRVKRESTTATESELSTRTLEQYSASNLGNALKQLSGVSTLSTGNTIVKPVIQGLHSSRVIVMNQGTRMQDQEWGVDHAPNIDLNAAGSVRVVKGASALQYGGDAVGGIILVEPVRMRQTDSVFGKVIATGATNGRGGSLAASVNKTTSKGWFAGLQGSVKRFGDFESPDYVLSNTGAYERAFQLRTGVNKLKGGAELSYQYFTTEIGILRAAHIGNLQDLEVAINREEPLFTAPFTYEINAPRQEVTHHLIKAKAYQRFAGLGTLHFQYDFQFNNRFEYDIRRGENANIPSIDMELTTHTVNSWFDFNASEKFKWKTGFMGRFQTNFPDPSTGVRRLIPDYDRYEVGAFAITTARLSSGLLAEGGIRYDFSRMNALKFYELERWESLGYAERYPELVVEEFTNEVLTNPILDFHNISATAGLKYAPEGMLSYQLNYAMAQRAPNPSELFSDGLHHSNATIELGDLELEAETSHKWSVSVQKLDGNLQFTLSPFVNLINDYIFMEPEGAEQTIRGAFPVWQYKQTDALFVGADWDLQWKVNPRLDFLQKVAFLKARDLDENDALVDIAPSNMSHILSYKIPSLNNLRLEVQSDYVFSQNEFPDNNFTITVIEDGEFVDKVVDISTPPPAYHLLGASAEVLFPFDSGRGLRVRLSGSNLLNTPYRDYLNRLRFFADDVGINVQLQIVYSF